MNPLLSIVIPVFRERDSIGACLEFLQGCDEITHCEIVVVDGDQGSTQTPTTLPNVSVLVSAPGRGHQLNVGADATTGDAMAFLHVDTRPPRDFVQRIAKAVRTFGAGAFDLKIGSKNPVVRIIGFSGMLRSRITRIPYGDQVQFVRRDVFRSVGGFPEIPIMEDVALMDRIKQAGETIVLLRPPAVTSGRRWKKEGAIRTTLRNWRLLAAYRAGVDPAVLVHSYQPHSHAARTGRLFRVRRKESEARALAVFFRALRPIGVKTRLAADIGQAAALSIYRGMLEDTRRWMPKVRASIVTFVDEPEAGDVFFAGSWPQHGVGLGERMANAFAELFEDQGLAAAVLIGTDVPDIDDSVVNAAFDTLGAHDAVIGPCVDGGYYLIGFSRGGFTGHAFDPLTHPPAATPSESAESSILASTVAAMRTQGRSVGFLEPLQDVDTLEDLKIVCADGGRNHPRLRAAVRRALGSDSVRQ